MLRVVLWTLTALVPPVVAFCLSAALPGEQAGTGEQHGVVVVRGSALPPVHRWRTFATCDEPELAEALDEYASLSAQRHEREIRETTVANVVKESITACEIELDVLGVDCEEEPCLIIGMNEYDVLTGPFWWNDLPFCEPWYGKFQGRGGGVYGTTIECPDGTSHRITGTWISLDPDHVRHHRKTLEGRIDRDVEQVRWEEAGIRLFCRES